MRAIFKREFKSYFNSMIGWAFLAVNLFFAGWYFRFNGMINGYPYISYILSGIMLIFICLVPVLTMKTFAEESKQKTDQLLYTSPISVWKIILGKYLALVSVLLFMLVVIFLYQFILSIYGDVPVGENFLAVVGFALFGMTCMAIGLFLSSITESQIIAAVLTFFVLMVGIMISGISNLISSTGNAVTKFLSIFNLTKPLNYFLYGIIYLPSFVYYFSIIFFLLYMTEFVIQKKRWSFSSHGLKKFLGSTLGFIVITALLIAVNFLIRMLPADVIKKDITYNNIYSITEESKNTISNLQNQIDLYVLVDGDNIDSTLDSTLRALSDESKNIKITYVSPTQNPYFYANYTDENPTDNSIIVVCGDKSKVVDYYDCYEMTYDYEYDYASDGYVVTDYQVTGYDGEGQIMSAIDYVTKTSIPRIYAITGHDEFEISSSLESKFNKENIEVEYLNLLTYDAVPEDAVCLLILGPLKDYSQDEINKVNSYLEKGGNAMFIISYTDSDELYNYYSILEKYNIKINEGLVMEQGTSFYNSQQYYLLPDIINTPITEDVYSSKRNKYVYMPFSKGMSLTQDYNDVTNIVFLQTTENAYALTDTSLEAQDQYPLMQFALGVFAEKNYPDAQSRIVAISSDYFMYEDVNMVVNDNNYTVFMKAIKQLVDDSSSVGIPVKSYSFNPIIMDETARTIASVFVIGLVPAVLILSGFFIWFDRRRR